MPPPPPLLIRVPMPFVRGRCSFSQVIARVMPSEMYHRAAWRFLLSSDERRFARELLAACPRLWLYRTDQTRQAGDFLAVDMSAPKPAQRRSWAIELKLGAPLRLGGGGASNQLLGVSHAASALAALGVAEAPPVLVCGDGREVAALLGG